MTRPSDDGRQPFRETSVVSAEPNSLLDELHSTVVCGEEERTLLRHDAFRTGMCPEREPQPSLGDRLRNLEAAVLAIARPAVPRSMGSDVLRPIRLSREACRKWNVTGCTYPKYRHLHVCSTCGGGHTASRCNIRGPCMELAGGLTDWMGPGRLET